MEIWILVLILLMFGLFEFIASFSFNIKIKMLDKKKYTHAAALGAFSTVLFMVLTLVSPIVASTEGAWFIFAGSAMMAVGNVSALLLLRPAENWWNKRNVKEEVK